MNYKTLLEKVKDVEPDIEKFYKRGSKAAAVRARNKLADIKRLCLVMRAEIQATKKEREEYGNLEEE